MPTFPWARGDRRVGDFVMWRNPGGIEGEVVELSQITVSVDDIDDVDETASAINTLLQQFHGDKEDYAVVVPKELLATGRTDAGDVQCACWS